ncbi:hypothetical protein [Rhizobium terrae]|uniref:hypothetical protein n=1 Tax=Rhizobium terrae TaxID=2171756 RepID=UPI000E3CE96E|nr:hypothetical protein [Rhizobium terrae]
MQTKPKSLLDLLNPFVWLAAIFGPLLRFLGLASPPQTGGFENISTGDVEDEARSARETEEAIDAIMEQMSPADVVKAYARADEDTRSTMDLSVLDLEGQDWLLNLSDEDLDLLGMSTEAACARSLQARSVQPAYRKPRPEAEAPAVLSTASADEEDYEEWKRQLVAKHFRELFHAPGVPNLEPKHTPGPTVH